MRDPSGPLRDCAQKKRFWLRKPHSTTIASAGRRRPEGTALKQNAERMGEGGSWCAGAKCHSDVVCLEACLCEVRKVQSRSLLLRYGRAENEIVLTDPMPPSSSLGTLIIGLLGNSC